mmetsp:Transcript_11235/g.33730  ORF Transcript_11235/g.33730 Transcript_11235/m.33730 type:complete len:97 (+) Transcript_11235:1532-1822(+)
MVDVVCGNGGEASRHHSHLHFGSTFHFQVGEPQLRAACSGKGLQSVKHLRYAFSSLPHFAITKCGGDQFKDKARIAQGRVCTPANSALHAYKHPSG